MKRKFMEIKGYDYTTFDEFKKDVEKKMNSNFRLISANKIEGIDNSWNVDINNELFKQFQPDFNIDEKIKVTAYFIKAEI